MRCTVCDKKIISEPDTQFVQISTFEYIAGEHAVYPTETERMTLCSLGCSETLLNNWRAARTHNEKLSGTGKNNNETGSLQKSIMED